MGQKPSKIAQELGADLVTRYEFEPALWGVSHMPCDPSGIGFRTFRSGVEIVLWLGGVLGHVSFISFENEAVEFMFSG